MQITVIFQKAETPVYRFSFHGKVPAPVFFY